MPTPQTAFCRPVQHRPGPHLAWPAAGGDRDAVTLLREGQDQIPSEERLQVEAQIKSLEAFLGELEVTTEPSGALLTIDGREIGRTPLSEPIRLAAGTHKIAASLDGRPTVERTVAMEKERRYQLYLQLPPPLPQPPSGGPDDAILRSPEVELIEPTPVRSRLRVALPYVLASAGVILAGAAVPAYLWERDAYHKWQNAQPALQAAQSGSPAYADAAKESNDWPLLIPQQSTPCGALLSPAGP